MTMTKSYVFRTTAGRICCATDDPTLLCSSCRRQAALATNRTTNKLRVARPKAPRPYTQAIEAQQGKRVVIREPHGSPRPYSTALAKLRGETDEIVVTRAGVPLPYSTALKHRAAEAR